MANPNPSTGFQDHPENINTEGRPPKDHTLTEILKDALKQPRTEDGKLKKEQLIDLMLEMALTDKDKDMIKYIFDRTDGKARQGMDIDLSGETTQTTHFIIEGGS